MRPLSPVSLTLPALLLAALGALSAVHAADYSPGPTPDRFTQVRAHVRAGQWRAAIDELKRIDDPASADWNSLMGYSLRKAATPDLDAAERYYDAALRIDPKHRGALEYSGELYLMKGDLASAEQRLALLDKACFLPCREFTELKKAVQQYKAAAR